MEIIKAARSLIPADIVLKNGKIIDVFNGTIISGDVAILGNTIAGIGSYKGKTEIDCANQYILPGLIDTHLHIESSMLSPQTFAAEIIKHGTTGIVVDPHEIANVCGMNGVNYIVSELAKTPINAKVMLPSCVPATSFETSGAILNSKTIAKEITRDCFFGLGEFMNYPGIINSDSECLAKIKAAADAGKFIDGHVMNLSDADMNAYFAAGIKTNHECITAKDLQDNIQRGAFVQLREGSYGKNVRELVKGITPQNIKRCLFCTDDKNINELTANGHLNNNLRVAVAAGLDPISAVTVATFNAATCYGFEKRGAIAPSYIADIVVMDNLKNFNAVKTFIGGKLISERHNNSSQSATLENQSNDVPEYLSESVLNTVKIKPVTAQDFSKVRPDLAIRFEPGKVITQKDTPNLKSNKIAVVERHKASGNIAVSYINGFDLTNGAIAQTIAHDSHNIICVGASDSDMALAVNECAKIGGGIVVTSSGKILQKLALPIAGLMTNISASELLITKNKLYKAVKSLGFDMTGEPFIELSFLALPVIPSIRITDKGLFDVNAFNFL